MRPRDWFSLGIRFFGVWVFFEGFSNLMAFAAIRLHLQSESVLSGGSRWPLGVDSYHLWYAIGNCALAAYFVFGGEQITRWAFHERRPSARLNDASDSADETT